MRTPTIVATNQPLAMYVSSAKDENQKAFDCRSDVYKFKNFDGLKHFTGHLNPGLWFLAARVLCMESIHFLGAPVTNDIFAKIYDIDI
jgi:hypothetical protein